MPLQEIPDTLHPVIEMVALNYKTGVMSFHMSETIVASTFDLSSIVISDIHYGDPTDPAIEDITIVTDLLPIDIGDTLVQDEDNTVFNITLSGGQVLEIIKMAELAAKSSISAASSEADRT